MRILPYLIFNGDCEEAINLYKEVFDGEITSLMRFEEAPDMPDMPVSEGWKKKIMHAEMKIGDDHWLYFSDAWEGSSVSADGPVSIHLDVDSEETLRKYFSGLEEGGKVTNPVDGTFWGAIYGSLIDKYGISWGFNCAVEQ